MSLDVKEYTDQITTRAKKASSTIRTLKTGMKNKVLHELSEELLREKDTIIKENQLDLEEGKKKGLSAALMDRLELNDKRIQSLAKSVQEIAGLPDPIGAVTRGGTLSNGLQLITKQVPLGVILVIFESRPNVTIDVASLAFKSGNVAILRGGTEAFHTNYFLCQLFQRVLKKFEITEDAILFVDKTDRSHMIPLLKKSTHIDLVVPRGGEALIQFVSENATIPVVKHDKGVCNLFVDKSAEKEIAERVIINSKLQRTGVCNALENLVIHREYPHRKELIQALESAGAQLLVDEETRTEFPHLKLAKEEDYYVEFLDERLSLKIVGGIDEAIENIAKYSSGHTEVILSESQKNINHFLQSLDSAALFVNCSSRFHDGGEFGLGAEVGISTGKLHVRGPMGLMHLTTTTTILHGQGQVRE
jgi:glutamate-5-semialdehyde dehydrogenase